MPARRVRAGRERFRQRLRERPHVGIERILPAAPQADRGAPQQRAGRRRRRGGSPRGRRRPPRARNRDTPRPAAARRSHPSTSPTASPGRRRNHGSGTTSGISSCTIRCGSSPPGRPPGQRAAARAGQHERRCAAPYGIGQEPAETPPGPPGRLGRRAVQHQADRQPAAVAVTGRHRGVEVDRLPPHRPTGGVRPVRRRPARPGSPGRTRAAGCGSRLPPRPRRSARAGQQCSSSHPFCNATSGFAVTGSGGSSAGARTISATPAAITPVAISTRAARSARPAATSRAATATTGFTKRRCRRSAARRDRAASVRGVGDDAAERRSGSRAPATDAPVRWIRVASPETRASTIRIPPAASISIALASRACPGRGACSGVDRAESPAGGAAERDRDRQAVAVPRSAGPARPPRPCRRPGRARPAARSARGRRPGGRARSTAESWPATARSCRTAGPARPRRRRRCRPPAAAGPGSRRPATAPRSAAATGPGPALREQQRPGDQEPDRVQGERRHPVQRRPSWPR